MVTVGIPLVGSEVLAEVGAAVFADGEMAETVVVEGRTERRALVQVELAAGAIAIRGDAALVERAKGAARAAVERSRGAAGTE